MPHAREFRAALIAGDQKKAAELAKGWQYAGYKMTIFSNTEEVWVERDILHAKMYFHVVDALKTAGGNVITTPVDFEPHVIVDRELVTGQNPASSRPARRVICSFTSKMTCWTKPSPFSQHNWREKPM